MRGSAESFNSSGMMEDDSIESEEEEGDTALAPSSMSSLLSRNSGAKRMMKDAMQDPEEKAAILALREEYQKSLREEQMLISLQMRLVSQLEKVKSSVATIECDTQLAKLAIDQARVARSLKRTEVGDAAGYNEDNHGKDGNDHEDEDGDCDKNDDAELYALFDTLLKQEERSTRTSGESIDDQGKKTEKDDEGDGDSNDDEEMITIEVRS